MSEFQPKSVWQRGWSTFRSLENPYGSLWKKMCITFSLMITSTTRRGTAGGQGCLYSKHPVKSQTCFMPSTCWDFDFLIQIPSFEHISCSAQLVLQCPVLRLKFNTSPLTSLPSQNRNIYSLPIFYKAIIFTSTSPCSSNFGKQPIDLHCSTCSFTLFHSTKKITT